MASIRKLPSGHYRVRWRDLDGIEQGSTVRTAKEARQLRIDVESETSHGVYRDPKAGREAFAEYLERSLSADLKLKPATQALYAVQARRVAKHFGARPIAGIKPADLREFYASMLSDSVGIPTVETVHRLVSRVLRQAVRDGIIPANPASFASPPRATRKPPRVLTAKEVFRLVFAIEARRHFPEVGRREGTAAERLAWRKNYVEEHEGEWPLEHFAGPSVLISESIMVLTAAFAGLRFGEVAALRNVDLNLSAAQPRLEITRAVSEVRGTVSIGETKTGTRRTVPIPHGLTPLLREADQWALMLKRQGDLRRGSINASTAKEWDELNERDRREPHLIFTTRHGHPWSRTRFRARVWEPAVELAAIDPPPHFHDLRHSYASWLIARGVDPKALQAWLGHSSIRTTFDVYGHLMPSHGADIIARLDSPVARSWHEEPAEVIPIRPLEEKKAP
jgi:integrase